MTPDQREVLLMLIEDLSDRGFRLVLYCDKQRGSDCLSLLLDPKISEAMSVMVELQKSCACELHTFLPSLSAWDYTGFVALDFSQEPQNLIQKYTVQLTPHLERALAYEDRLRESADGSALH